MRLHRTLVNVVLVAAAALLGAVLWLDREREPAPEPLTSLSRDAITQIRVSYPAALDVALERSDGGWRMQSPVTSRAEESEVTQILRLAGADVRREYPAGEIDAAEVGLDEPPYTVVFTTAQGESAHIDLGDTAALERSRYARVGDTVYLIDEPNIQALDADYSNLVAWDILPKDAKLAKVELPGATLTRGQDTGGWKVAPEGADQGADAAQKTVDAWRNARAMWMKPADDAKTEGLVRLHLADGTVRELAVVARKPQLILRDPALGVHYHVAANEAGPLLDMSHDGEKKEKNRAKTPRREEN